MEKDYKRILRIPSSRQIKRSDFREKTVLLRLDLNVPIDDGKILDYKRIVASMPTLKKILERGAKKVNIICHLGRPEGEDKNFSTRFLSCSIQRYLHSKGNVTEVKTDSKSPALSKYYILSEKVNLYENLRFDRREEKNNLSFAKELSKLGDVFVLDAFANIHRKHSSMDKLQDMMPTYAGLLIEKEVKAIFGLILNPQRPFIALIGGAKYEDKMPVIESLSKKCEAILVGGKTANEMILKNKFSHKNIFLPVDGVSGKGRIVQMEPKNIKEGVYDIGPKTIMQFKAIINSAQTIFINGNLGMTEDKKFVHGTSEVIRYIAKHKAEKFASGGNTADIIDDLNLNDGFDFISTGGGATSDLLSGKELPVLNKLLGGK